MTISATDIKFDDQMMHVSLSDGRVLSVPLAWFPRLLAASLVERQNFAITNGGIHWENLDEDISIDGLLAGHGDRTQPPHRAA